MRLDALILDPPKQPHPPAIGVGIQHVIVAITFRQNILDLAAVLEQVFAEALHELAPSLVRISNQQDPQSVQWHEVMLGRVGVRSSGQRENQGRRLAAWHSLDAGKPVRALLALHAPDLALEGIRGTLLLQDLGHEVLEAVDRHRLQMVLGGSLSLVGSAFHHPPPVRGVKGWKSFLALPLSHVIPALYLAHQLPIVRW